MDGMDFMDGMDGGSFAEPPLAAPKTSPAAFLSCSRTLPLHLTGQKICAASSVISANPTRFPSFSTACAGSNIAATIARGWPCSKDGKIEVRKRIGRIANLAELLQESPTEGTLGISHTRWATHGGVTDANAHPHFDQSGKLSLVHNGVIENYAVLREQLIKEGHEFQSRDRYRSARASHRQALRRRRAARRARAGSSRRCAPRCGRSSARTASS